MIRISSRSDVRPTSAIATPVLPPIRSASAQASSPSVSLCPDRRGDLLVRASARRMFGRIAACIRMCHRFILTISCSEKVPSADKRLGIQRLKAFLFEELLGLLDLIDADHEDRLPAALPERNRRRC